MENDFNRSIEDTAALLKTDIVKGLTEAEAAQRLKTYGENRLEGKKEKGLAQMFLSQFKDFLVIILIVAAVISIGLSEYLEGIIIIAIVILNACLGVFQENKASNALKALKEMSSPRAKVLRNGSFTDIESSLVVPGDIVLLEAGDYIPADVRLIEAVNLKIDEAALTGESVPVEKHTDTIENPEAGIGDRANSGFMGTVVTYGRGKAIVTATGMKTQMGSIAAMLNDTEDETTPLQQKLNSLGKLLGLVCLGVCVLIFLLGVLHKMNVLDIFITAVSLAVAAIPEGLTVVVTVILAMGMQKMVKSNAIVKRLSAVETLGSTTVICSDKTGTLTQNKMTVVKLYDMEKVYDVTGRGYTTQGGLEYEGKPEALNDTLVRLIEGGALCNDASFNAEAETIIGDPTEGALVVLSQKLHQSKGELDQKYPRVDEIPFDSDRKLMSTLHKTENGLRMYVKGAPDELLRRARFAFIHGEIQPLDEQMRNRMLTVNQNFAQAALRVLGVAFKGVEGHEMAEEDLVFTGLLAMIDPPREEAKAAIATCKEAGITVKMITGDHKVTAGAIAAELGIAPAGSGSQAVEGREIGAMTDAQLQEKVKEVNVFARVSPEHKVRLVTAIKANGEIAAMTGDGVNDAPSLKRADIGIAMGITGTDVSKEAADMILTDDNFASIVKAVEEGRTIYNNIRKVVAYLLSCNIGEILIIFIAMVLRWPVPLVPIQLLSINLITDAFPAFALGMEEKEAGIMKEKPRNPKEGIVNKKMRIAVGIQSVALALGALCSYSIGRWLEGDAAATTFCFVTLVLGELLRAYSARSEKRSLFKGKLFSNRFLNKSVSFSLVFLALAVYVPFLNPVFSTIALSPIELLIAVLFAFIPVIAGEIAKKIR